MYRNYKLIFFKISDKYYSKNNVNNNKKNLGKCKSRVSHNISRKVWGRQNIGSKKLHFFAAKSSMEFVVNLSKKGGYGQWLYWA